MHASRIERRIWRFSIPPCQALLAYSHVRIDKMEYCGRRLCNVAMTTHTYITAHTSSWCRCRSRSGATAHASIRNCFVFFFIFSLLVCLLSPHSQCRSSSHTCDTRGLWRHFRMRCVWTGNFNNLIRLSWSGLSLRGFIDSNRITGFGWFIISFIESNQDRKFRWSFGWYLSNWRLLYETAFARSYIQYE